MAETVGSLTYIGFEWVNEVQLFDVWNQKTVFVAQYIPIA